jgi:ribosomal protein S18 acetylase RimI-like enzyme
MEIRKAKKNDSGKIAELMYSAGPELYDIIYLTEKTHPLNYIRFEFESGRGLCGYKNVTVFIKDGVVVATGCFYSGKEYKKLLAGTLMNMIHFFGPIKALPALLRANHTASVIKEPRNTELYLANFGVCPDLRGTGIGSRMVQTQIEAAKSKGYEIFSLDVADTNPKAEALYSRLGFETVDFKKFSGRRKGMNVPNTKKMELVLS